MKQEDKSGQTKQRFAETLKELLQQKPLTKITVSQLVTACGLNRKTFYYHFQDLYDLLRWMLEQEAIEVIRQYDLLTEYEEAIQFVMDYMQQNGTVLRNICHNAGRDRLKDFFFLGFVSIFRRSIDTVAERNRLSLSEEFLHYQSHFYAEAVAGLMVEWVENEIKLAPEQAVLYISTILRSSIPAVLHTADGMDAFRRDDV
ncbi:MAG: TetR/AcrR family transcriptional regulator C-terminal domain-containing protein [Clostridiales bacterium]|nr:TetR/AcrR family transcriptional regulator C-terminal domain-containing protein [Clostridiales bacterium]